MPSKETVVLRRRASENPPNPEPVCYFILTQLEIFCLNVMENRHVAKRSLLVEKQ